MYLLAYLFELSRCCLFQSLYLAQILIKLPEIIYSFIHSTFNLCVDPLFTHRYFVTNCHYTRESLYRNRAQRFLSLREPVERGDWIWSRKLFLYSGRSGGAFLPSVNKVQHFKKVLLIKFHARYCHSFLFKFRSTRPSKDENGSLTDNSLDPDSF